MAKAKKPTKKTNSTAKARPKQGTKTPKKAAAKKPSPKVAKPTPAAKKAASTKPKQAKAAKAKAKPATPRKATAKLQATAKKTAPAAKVKAKAKKTTGKAKAASAGPGVHLRVGDLAPDFTLPADGAEGGTCQLSEHRGRHNVILYFYPKDDTSGCTKQACSFQNHLEQFHGGDAVVIGMSPDGLKSHAKFRAKYELHFQLAADLGAEIAQRYGVWVPKSMYGRNYMGIQRTTFLIDKTGHIAAIWPKVKVDGHSDEVLDALRLL